jgi:hypothetical protein
MAAPPLLLERSEGAQIAVAVGGALILGIVCGILLGVNEAASSSARRSSPRAP